MRFYIVFLKDTKLNALGLLVLEGRKLNLSEMKSEVGQRFA